MLAVGGAFYACTEIEPPTRSQVGIARSPRQGGVRRAGKIVSKRLQRNLTSREAMDGEISSGCANNDDQENPLAKSAPAPDLTSPSPFKVYKRRWFLLAVVCLLNSSNAMLWLTFAPVADQTAKRFHTTMDMVNWLSIVYLVISVPVGFLAIWILDTVGLKCAVLLCAWLNMMGSIIRIFSVLDVLSLGSLNFAYLLLGQCLCAAAQPLIIFSPTKLAALWFPDHQRATANMIGSMSNPLGLLIANLLSPALVKEDKDIPLMLGVYAGPAAFACVLATIGVHRKVPPTPPSASAFQSNSLSFSRGLKMLLRNKAYLILATCLGSGIALFTCYSALLEQILCVNGYSDSFAGMCGAFFTVFGLIGAFFLGLYVDRTKKFTEVTKICFCLTALANTAFAVMCHYRNQTYAMASISALFGLFGFALYPIAMELAVECSYPVGEGTTSGLIFVISQLLGMLFMFLFQNLAVKKEEAPFSTCTVASGGALDWTTSTLVMAGLSCAVACTFVVSFQTDYRRISAETSRGYSVNTVEDVAVTAQS